MIHVAREQEDGGVPIRPNQDWFDQATTLTDQAVSEGAAHQVHQHYRHPQVKMALEKLFHDKCAYCEGAITSSGPWEVEHYRPKGRVRENKEHPGYYWLAYTWENFVPSCQFCNGHYEDKPTFDDPNTAPAAGKYDQFPLFDEEHRAMEPDDPLDAEAPILLNPCKDQDCESYFLYDLLGHILASEQDTHQRAVETIRICNLDRKRLRTHRANLVTKMVKAVQIHEAALSVRNDDPTKPALIEFAQGLLAAFLDAGSEFAGTARYIDQNRHAFNPDP